MLLNKRLFPGIICLILMMLSLQLTASLRLPSLLNSNMVLQRNAEARIWGWADPGTKVSVKASWLESEQSAIATGSGYWLVKIPTGNAGGPYTLSIRDKDTLITLKEILLGEVWVCSGQSNMEFTINMFGGWNKTYPKEMNDLVQSGFEHIRLFTVAKDTSSQEKPDCSGNWLKADTATVANFSATAWFFGVELSKKLGVPVGLILSAWGGTPAEAWTARNTIEQDPELEFYLTDPNKTDWWPTQRSVLFNAMIYPLTKTAIRGVIWYQGESNVRDAATYPKLFAGMVHGWRTAWGVGNFPFYYVQIAPFTYERAVTGALLREAQLRSLVIPNSGMAVTLDIVDDVTDIHPKNKQDVGKRLAALALSNTYEFDKIISNGPVYKTYEKSGRSIRLLFDDSMAGLELRAGKNETGFRIAGADRQFVPAKVSIDGNSLLLKSDMVKEPEAVRYAFSNTSAATLFNSSGLPASSFRTDDWPIYNTLVFMKPDFDPVMNRMSYKLFSEDPEANIHYTLDSSEPDCKSILYKNEGIIPKTSGRLSARACIQGFASESISSWLIYQHKGIAASADYLHRYAQKYSANGDYGLVDGIKGSLVYNDGAWQGFEREDLSVTLDLGESTLVRKVTMQFLSDTNSWIFLPKYVEISTSVNGTHFENATRLDNIADMTYLPDSKGKEIVTLRAPLMKAIRYIRIFARNQAVCPKGHPGEGQNAWLFIDEVILE